MAVAVSSSPRFAAISIAVFLILSIIALSFRSTTYTSTPHSPSKIGKTHLSTHSNDHLSRPRHAFATFLAGKPGSSDDDRDEDDGYYLSARVLIYQLLHSPTAGTNSSIPFLVLVTPDVSPRKRARLTLDGAIVVPVEKLSAEWVHPANERWTDVLTKLRLWQQISYEKICFIDADMLVTAPLDGVFYDEAALEQHTGANPAQLRDDEASLPQTYSFATHSDLWGFDHAYPPIVSSTYLNCGFFVFAPSEQMFAYYMSLLALEGRFDPAFPEQNLLNYAHRREGNMPWRPVWYGWNVNWPTRRDWEGGARSFHAKYWDGDPSHDVVLKALWREQRAEMEGFHRGRDAGGW